MNVSPRTRRLHGIMRAVVYLTQIVALTWPMILVKPLPPLLWLLWVVAAGSLIYLWERWK